MKYKRLCSTAALACLVAVAAVCARADDSTPAPATGAGAQAAKDALARLADAYQKANDLTYSSTLVVYAPPDPDVKTTPSETLMVTGAAEKPDKFSIKAYPAGDAVSKKLAEFIYSDGTNAYEYDPVTGFYDQVAAPTDGLDIAQIHTSGMMEAADFATEFAGRAFFEDEPYDLGDAATVASDVQYASQETAIANEPVLAITETYTNEHGVTTTLNVTLDKATGLPRRVSEEITKDAQTNTVFKEDFDTIKLSSTAADLGTYAWQPPAGTVMNWSPPSSTDSQGASASSDGAR